MKRFALFLGVSLFVACGDNSSNNNTNPVCGDGEKTGTEQCDDGNTTSGDGCSSTCTTETAPTCGDHHVDTGEECDDGNTTSGDGCSATCQTESANPVCGDHHVDTGEQCDDGNTTNGDGCSSTCQNEATHVCGNGVVETGETCDDNNTTAGDGCNATCAVEMNYTCTGMPSVCTLMPGSGTCATPFNMGLVMLGTTYVATGTNDTTASTNQVAESTCNSEDAAGGGFDHQWRFVNPVAQKVVITLNSHVNSATAFDGVIRLMTTVCDVTTQVPDDTTDGGDPDGCTDLFGASTSEVQTYTNLPAGTYYIDVDGYGDGEVGMYSLTVAGGSPTCGNGVIEPGETCDDNNTTASDGCSATCAVETGYSCAGSPSVCTLNCGNGTLETGEGCDDNNTTAGDGCTATCTVEAGYSCTGTPSVCTFVGGTCAAPRMIDLTLAGGIYSATETGDTTATASEVAASTCDNQTSSGAGHDQVWKFVNPVTQPVLFTLTAATTFDGALRLMSTACSLATQVPDDVVSGDSGATADGCADLHGSATAERLNYNWLPAGTYYLVVDGFIATSNGMYTFTVKGGGGTCGNGVLDQNERCDDGNLTAGDGCSGTCTVEPTFTCTGAPSVCTTTCGNGTINTGEVCDDGARVPGDGCSATCQVETGYACAGTPSACHAIVCGDGIKDTGEGCDDSNATAGDGCSATCQVEAGYVCTGTPSVCHAVVCGDGLIDVGEGCDDGNAAAGDGCSSACQIEFGYNCTGTPSVCAVSCGNGIFDGNEECDSMGVTNAYCTADCHLVFDTTDTEDNSTGATAQTITPTHHIIKGSLPANDLDVYKFTLTATSTVTIETFTTYAQNHTNNGSAVGVAHAYCPTADTEVSVFTDPAAVMMADPTASTLHNDDGGDGSCSYLVPGTGMMLPAGTYYFTVHDYDGNGPNAISTYVVDFKVVP